MTTMNEIIAFITEHYDAIPCRTKSLGNFLAVKGEIVEGIQTYYAIKVSAPLYKPTAVNPAFDVDLAHAEYEAYIAKLAERANKPKKEKVVDEAKVAAKAKRQNLLKDFLKQNVGVPFTSKDIFDSLPDVYGDHVIMTVGTDLRAIAAGDENLTFYEEDKKRHWTYIG